MKYLPFFVVLVWRLALYLVSIQAGHYVEGDTALWIRRTENFNDLGYLGSSFVPPGYPIFLQFFYHRTNLGAPAAILVQSALEMTLLFFMMKKVKFDLKPSWILALFYGLEWSVSFYANSIMSESLSGFFLTAFVLLALSEKKYFWGGVLLGASFWVRSGNYPLLVVFGIAALISHLSIRKGLSCILGALLLLTALIFHNWKYYNDPRPASQSDYHWTTLGAGVIMRQKGVTWYDGEQEFVRMQKEKSESLGRPVGYREIFFEYIGNFKGAFVFSVVRGFATQFFGGLNAEFFHRFFAREIARDPLPSVLHWSMITFHGLWMLALWILYFKIPWKIHLSGEWRILFLFVVLAHLYFFISVATLGSARFRSPLMGATAFYLALRWRERESSMAQQNLVP